MFVLGWRENMEDAHVFTFELPHHNNSAFFGVFDGHAGILSFFLVPLSWHSCLRLGNKCSPYVAQNLPTYVDKVENWSDERAVVKACLDCDEAFLTECAFSSSYSLMSLSHPFS